MRCGRPRPRPWPPRGRAVAVWVRQYMTSTEFWDFWKPIPPHSLFVCCILFVLKFAAFPNPLPISLWTSYMEAPYTKCRTDVGAFFVPFLRSECKKFRCRPIGKRDRPLPPAIFRHNCTTKYRPILLQRGMIHTCWAAIQLKMEISREG